MHASYVVHLLVKPPSGAKRWLKTLRGTAVACYGQCPPKSLWYSQKINQSINQSINLNITDFWHPPFVCVLSLVFVCACTPPTTVCLLYHQKINEKGDAGKLKCHVSHINILSSVIILMMCLCLLVLQV